MRVIIDATEILVEQPDLPECQQITFYNYKNHNTYKGLFGISPSDDVAFVSDLYSGSISDRELTRKCGLLNLLEAGDSVMADRGFDIKDNLELLGVEGENTNLKRWTWLKPDVLPPCAYMLKGL